MADTEERPDEVVEDVPEPRREWAEGTREAQSIFVDTGRGQGVEVQAGDSFTATLERLADDAHYGGYFRVFVNGSEVINPEDAPQVIEPGMRIAITSYDKVGVIQCWCLGKLSGLDEA